MENPDKHPGDEAWLELAYNVCSQEMATVLKQHLDAGCAKCRSIYDLWVAVAQIAARESDYEAPAEVIRALKSALPLRRKAPWLDRLAEAARLLYDSFQEPLPAGVRSSHSTARLLVYETVGFTIDLRVEVEAEGSQWISGRIASKGQSPEYTTKTGVVVLGADKSLVAQTTANQSGEFQVGFPSEERITAYLELPGGPLIGIKIPSPSHSGPDVDRV
jgi:hypothetical protein